MQQMIITIVRRGMNRVDRRFLITGVLGVLLLIVYGGNMAFGRFKINSPSFKEESFNGIKYRLCKPINYSSNNSTLFPLVVFLHGAGERGTDNRRASLGLSYLGNGFSYDARTFKKKFPSFVYVPQAPKKTTWDGKNLENVIATIDHLTTSYPIDPKRLYLIGYSMGGSGTYALSDTYYKHSGQLFAGIIRLAGQGSFSDQVHSTISKSSLWLHIGLNDTPLRVAKARKAYAFQKKVHPTATEKITEKEEHNQVVVTKTLSINNTERFKLSEYSMQGHNINQLPFEDPAVLNWLFSQTLK
jgi:predicted peptidase